MALKDVGVNLVAEGLDNFKRTMSDAGKSVGGFAESVKANSQALRMIGMSMAALGGAIVGAAALSVKSYVEMGHEIDDMAKRTGWATESLSELRHVAEMSGTSLSGLEINTRYLSNAIVAAQDGTESYIKSFARIGINAQSLKGMKVEDQFWVVADALSRVSDDTMRTSLAMDLFGRSGTNLLPIFAQGADAIARVRQETYNMGLVFDEVAAKKASEMAEQMKLVNEQVNGLKIVLAEVLLPTLTDLATKISNVIKGIKDWTQAHPVLFSALTEIFTKAGLVLVPLGGIVAIVPKVIAQFALVSKFIMATLIPRLVALTAVIWAKVAALLAATIASGPTGWAAALGVLASITAGVIVLNKIHNEGLQDLTKTTEELTKETNEAADSLVDIALGSAVAAEKVDILTESMRALYLAASSLGEGASTQGSMASIFGQQWIREHPEEAINMKHIIGWEDLDKALWPQLSSGLSAIPSSAVASQAMSQSMTIEVPVNIDGREVARIVASPFGEMVMQRGQIGG